MFDSGAIQAVPGMIESVEQRLLYDLASSLSLDKGDAMVEFGTFFGRSTFCLASGLTANPMRGSNNRLFAFDSFGCSTDGSFAAHVRSFAQAGGVENLVKIEGGRMDFLPVFEHYLQTAIKDGIVQPVRAELKDSMPGKIARIALMHIDSPKFYEELKVVISRYFPLLRPDAVVVFQDFYYPWSATLIAAVEAMRQRGWLEYRMSAASSLVVQFGPPPTEKQIADLDNEIQDGTRTVDLVMQAIAASTHIQIDRPEQFLPRLWLAAYQFLWSEDRHAEATDLIAKFLKSGIRLTQPVLEDYLGMMREGFSIRKLYDLDHQQA